MAVPGARGARGPRNGPAESILAGLLHLVNMVHDPRKAFWIRPELEYALDRLMNRDGFLKANGASAANQSEEAAQREIRDGSRQYEAT